VLKLIRQLGFAI